MLYYTYILLYKHINNTFEHIIEIFKTIIY